MEKGVADPKLLTLEKIAEALNRDLYLHIKAAEPG
jgi:hypothetical protein